MKLYILYSKSYNEQNFSFILFKMCSGSFVESSGLEDSSSREGNNSINTSTSQNQHQVALGSENGSVYIMDNFQVSLWMFIIFFLVD